MTVQDGFLLYENEQKQNRDIGFALLMVMATAGAMLIMAMSLMESPDWRILVPGTLAGAILPMISGKRTQQAILLMLIVVGMLMLTAWRGIFRSGMLQLINSGIGIYNNQHGTEIYYFDVPTNEPKGFAEARLPELPRWSPRECFRNDGTPLRRALQSH